MGLWFVTFGRLGNILCRPVCPCSPLTNTPILVGVYRFYIIRNVQIRGHYGCDAIIVEEVMEGCWPDSLFVVIGQLCRSCLVEWCTWWYWGICIVLPQYKCPCQKVNLLSQIDLLTQQVRLSWTCWVQHINRNKIVFVMEKAKIQRRSNLLYISG